jgi:hypothetical protein
MERSIWWKDGWMSLIWTRRTSLVEWTSRLFLARWAMIRKDWRAGKNFLPVVLLLVLTLLVVVAYYLNHPQPEPLADTWSYLYVVDRMQAHGQLANFWRLPGYPGLIWLVYALAGQGNLGAVSVTQGLLFVLSVLELYILCALVLRRAWVAFLLGLLIGTNVALLSYVKPIMSEGIALWLLMTLALAVTLFLRTWRPVFLWLVTLCTLLLFFTRPEWIYLPSLLFAYLLLVAGWRGMLRHFWPRILLALVLVYGVLGGYVFLNATQNHFSGVTWLPNISLLGKVLQYRMEDEASPQDAEISRILDTYAEKGITDPYIILSQQPVLARDYAARSGEFAKWIILHHPVEFLLKSVPVFFTSLTSFHLESKVWSAGPFGAPLVWLQKLFHTLYLFNICFLFSALVWLILLSRRKTRQLEIVQQMGAIVMLVLYGLILIALAAYRDIDYVRIRALLDPLVFLCIWGTVFALFQFLRGEKLWSSVGTAGLVGKSQTTARVRSGGVQAGSSSRFSTFPSAKRAKMLLVLCLLLLVLGGGDAPAPHGFADLVPLFCHQETGATMLRGTGVGILFITIENRGQDASPSTMRVEFATRSIVIPQVRLDVQIQALPAGAERWIMVDIPQVPRGGEFLDPAGPVKISLDVTNAVPEVKWADSTLLTACGDPI